MTCCLPLLVALAVPAADWPPEPDFTTKVDYHAWWEAQVRRGDPAEQNAYELLRTVLPTLVDPRHPPSKVEFQGPRSSAAAGTEYAPAPWDPAQHPDWEQSYQRNKELLDTIQRAAPRPYLLVPLHARAPQPRELRVIDEAIIPALSDLRACAKGLSDAAWRAAGGKVDPARFQALCQSGLQLAAQLEREPLILTRHFSAAMRAIVYQDLRFALHHGVFSPPDRAAVLTILTDAEAGFPALSPALVGEYAVHCDLLQFARLGTGEIVVEPELKVLLARIRAGEIDAGQTLRALHEYYERLIAAERVPYAPDTRRKLAALAEQTRKTNAYTALVAVPFGRAFDVHFSTLADTRGTRLLYAAFVYRDEHGRWPLRLAELPPPHDEQALRDPFSGAPFVYQLVDGQPRLYSVARNAKDDDGRHDPAWGGSDDQARDTDFVFWPASSPRP